MTQRGQIIAGYLLGETLGMGTYGKYVERTTPSVSMFLPPRRLALTTSTE